MKKSTIIGPLLVNLIQRIMFNGFDWLLIMLTFYRAIMLSVKPLFTTFNFDADERSLIRSLTFLRKDHLQKMLLILLLGEMT